MVVKKQRKVDLQRLRNKDHRDLQQSRYRHLYHVRRINGDVISQVWWFGDGRTGESRRTFVEWQSVFVVKITGIICGMTLICYIYI